MKRPVFGWLLALLLASCGGTAPPSSTPALSTPTAKPSASSAASAAPVASIKLGFSQVGVGYAPLFTAKDAGFFSKNGLDVTLQQVAGPSAVPALLADEVQFDGLGANELTRSVLAGAPLIGIATLGDVPMFVLYADKKYKTIQDLVGQTIGVTALGSSTDVTARLFLDHYGLLGKVNIAAAGGQTQTVLAALQQGVVQAVIVSPDAGVQAAKAGFVPLVEGAKLGVPLNFSVIAVKTSYVTDHADVVKPFLKAYQQTWNYLGDPANKAAAMDVLAKRIQAPVETVEVGYTPWTAVWSGQRVPTINPEGIGNTLKFSDDPKAKAAKGEQFIDNSILQSIQ
jgi:ABC-type nitrate/sulfonate/bicarbonate transport system substrate-binding protein